MKTTKQTPTGPADALKYAYEFLVSQKYTHKKLRDLTGISWDSLRKIRDDMLGEKSPIDGYYLPKFYDVLEEEKANRLRNGGDKTIECLLAIDKTSCLEHNVRYRSGGSDTNSE